MSTVEVLTALLETPTADRSPSAPPAPSARETLVADINAWLRTRHFSSWGQSYFIHADDRRELASTWFADEIRAFAEWQAGADSLFGASEQKNKVERCFSALLAALEEEED